jgi:hypothetical protein
MMPVPDVDMIKGGFWPVVELVDMHRFHSPFFLKKAHRYNTCPTIFVVFRLYYKFIFIYIVSKSLIHWYKLTVIV